MTKIEQFISGLTSAAGVRVDFIVESIYQFLGQHYANRHYETTYGHPAPNEPELAVTVNGEVQGVSCVVHSDGNFLVTACSLDGKYYSLFVAIAKVPNTDTWGVVGMAYSPTEDIPVGGEIALAYALTTPSFMYRS